MNLVLYYIHMIFLSYSHNAQHHHPILPMSFRWVTPLEAAPEIPAVEARFHDGDTPIANSWLVGFIPP